jgi:hypothetical protein
MINLLRAIRYNFCVNSMKFYAAESILNNFYYCMNYAYNKKVTPSYVLTDKIMADLQQLKERSSEK